MVAILSDVSKGMPIEGFGRTKPKGLETATVDAFTGMKPGGGTRKTVEELFLPNRAQAIGQCRRGGGCRLARRGSAGARAASGRW